MYCNKCTVELVCLLICEWEMLRQVKRVWLIVNIDLLCVPLLAGDNRCIWGKKKKTELCIVPRRLSGTNSLAAAFNAAFTDYLHWSKYRHGRLWVTSPPDTNTLPSIVPPLTLIDSFPWRLGKFKSKRNCDSIWVLAGYMHDVEKVKKQMW